MAERPFAPRELDDGLTTQLDTFVKECDFVKLYKSYSWKSKVWLGRRDTHSAGFPSILGLEVELGRNAKCSSITLDDVKKVARWGGLPAWNNVKISAQHGCQDVFRLIGMSLSGRIPSSNDFIVEVDPTLPAKVLDKCATGIGPTYVSKVLRFALPSQYGVIDSQLVRVVGNGDPDNNRQQWLQATAYLTDKSKKRWGIQPHKWTEHYGVWINILRYFAQKLNSSQELSVKCPHPRQFVDAGLRSGGIWTCADVEIALFAYASGVINDGC